MVYACIETTPYDSIKYKVDMETGYLLVDRQQRTCYGKWALSLCPKAEEGDADPVGICIVSERPIGRPVWPFCGRPTENSGPRAAP